MRATLTLAFVLRNERGEVLPDGDLVIGVDKHDQVRVTLSQGDEAQQVLVGLDDFQEAINEMWKFLR
jgi:hypothetical protein